MSSRSRYWPALRSMESSRMSLSELSSHGPAARKPSATVARGSAGNSTSPPIGRRRWLQTLGEQAFEYEVVDRVARPISQAGRQRRERGRERLLDRLQ